MSKDTVKRPARANKSASGMRKEEEQRNAALREAVDNMPISPHTANVAAAIDEATAMDKPSPTTEQIDDLSSSERQAYIAKRKGGYSRAEAYATVIMERQRAKKKTQKKKVVKKKAKKKTENTQKKTYKKKGGNGGARNNSGRKEGIAARRTREIADKLAESDETSPLEYMLGVLRETPEKLKAKFDTGEIDSAEYIVELQAMQKRKDNAAEKAAPYIHPRLSSIEAKINDGAHERWLALLAEAERNA